MPRKLMVELDDRTFALLEVLVYGLHKENPTKWALKHNKVRDDLGLMVSDLLVHVACSLAEGVTDSNGWELYVLQQLTDWQGTFNRGMAAECIKDEMATWETR